MHSGTQAQSPRLTSTNPIVTADQQTFSPFIARDEEIDEAPSGGKGKEKAESTYMQTDFDYVANVESIFYCLDDPKQTKQDTNQTFQHDNRSTVELTKTDVANVITSPRLFQLPNEIVSLIPYKLTEHRRTLYQCSLVNKQFHEITNPLLWKDPIRDIESEDDTFAERFFTCISNAQPTTEQHVRKLDLSSLFWTDIRLVLLIPHVRHLDELEIWLTTQDHQITDEGFQHLPRYCPLLTSLYFAFTSFTNPSFLALGQHCHQLRHLTLHSCHFVPLETFELLVECPLEELTIICGGSENEFLNEKTMADIGKFNRLTSLTMMTLSGAAIPFLLKMTTTPWPCLTNLKLNCCHAMDDATFIPFIRSLPHLQDLSLSSTNFTDASLDAMSTWLPSLTRVFLAGNSNISTDGVRRWIQHEHQMVSVQLYRCDRILPSHFPQLLYPDSNDTEMVTWNRIAIVKIRKTMTNESNNSNNIG